MALFNRKKKVNVLVLRTAGTNCDRETAFAFEQCGAETETVHINEFLKQRKRFAPYQILAIPGGFSYGDDIAAGRMLANELKFQLADALNRFAGQGKLILGICNGFQALVKTGLLPGGDGEDKPKVGPQRVTLFDNDSSKFECRWVALAVNPDSKCVFTKGRKELIELPVAHAEGKLLIDSDETLKKLKASGQIVVQYAGRDGSPNPGYPANPNGSIADIAGLCDSTGRIFGLMPHPERFIVRHQHPNWTREQRPPQGDGLFIFKNAVAFAQENL